MCFRERILSLRDKSMKFESVRDICWICCGRLTYGGERENLVMCGAHSVDCIGYTYDGEDELFRVKIKGAKRSCEFSCVIEMDGCWMCPYGGRQVLNTEVRFGHWGCLLLKGGALGSGRSDW